MNLNQQNYPFLQASQQIPLFPIYGYDNVEEAEKDFDYMKQLYPRDSRRIQELIEDTCDRLEYEGSIMFDEFPDRLQIALMANKIYNQVAPSAVAAEPAMSAGAATAADLSEQDISGQRGRRPGSPPFSPPGQNLPCQGPNCRPGQDPNWLRNAIEVMLCGEMCHRRRRHRSRRRWM